jgi:hypothetical protein
MDVYVSAPDAMSFSLRSFSSRRSNKLVGIPMTYYLGRPLRDAISALDWADRLRREVTDASKETLEIYRFYNAGSPELFS